VLLLAIFVVLQPECQSFRVAGVRWIDVEPREDLQPSVSVRVDEMAAVRVSSNTRFLESMVVEVVISDALRRYADSFAVGIYRGVQVPGDSQGPVAVSARRIRQEVLPYASRFYLKVPMSAGALNAPADPGTVTLDRVLTADDFPVGVMVEPVMKGIPDAVLSRSFFLTVKPQLIQRGVLELAIVKPADMADAPAEVLLDSVPVVVSDAPMELDAGIHRIEVLSDVFRRETSSFAVVAGQTVSVEIVLKPSDSFLLVDAPAGAEVYLDGELVLPGPRVELTEGTHAIRFKLGDISVSRKFDVRPGKLYTVSLLLDVVLKEE
jgi:hypothetical protein